MPRFSLKQLLMGTALLGVILVLFQSGGCGERFSKIETLEFSSDGSKILVAREDSRDAMAMRRYVQSELSRTVSWLDTETGDSLGVVYRDLRGGSSIPKSWFFDAGRTPVACRPSNDDVAMVDFAQPHLIRILRQSADSNWEFTHPVENVAFSSSGRLLVAYGSGGFTVLDTETEAVVLECPAGAQYCHDYCNLAFTPDESTLVTVGFDDIFLWNLESKKPSSISLGGTSMVSFVGATNERVLVGESDQIRQYDLSGTWMGLLGEDGCCTCDISENGSVFASIDEEGIRLFDLKRNERLKSIPFAWPWCFALSSDGRRIAVGGRDGQVTLLDAETGEKLWVSKAPGSYRVPWTLPVALLLVWWFVLRWIRSDGMKNKPVRRNRLI